jgi:hypothetical protein
MLALVALMVTLPLLRPSALVTLSHFVPLLPGGFPILPDGARWSWPRSSTTPSGHGFSTNVLAAGGTPLLRSPQRCYLSGRHGWRCLFGRFGRLDHRFPPLDSAARAPRCHRQGFPLRFPLLRLTSVTIGVGVDWV